MQPTTEKKEQARSIETREAFIEALSILIETKSLHAISISDLAAVADRSVGSFYTKFRDKDELLQALLERYEAERLRMDFPTLRPERWAGMKLDEAIYALVTITVDEYRRRRGLFRAFAHRSHQLASSPPEERKQSMGLLYDRIAEILLGYRTEINHSDPERAVRFAFFLITSACSSGILFSDDAHPSILEFTDEELVRNLSDAIVAFLEVAR